MNRLITIATHRFTTMACNLIITGFALYGAAVLGARLGGAA